MRKNVKELYFATYRPLKSSTTNRLTCKCTISWHESKVNFWFWPQHYFWTKYYLLCMKAIYMRVCGSWSFLAHSFKYTLFECPLESASQVQEAQLGLRAPITAGLIVPRFCSCSPSLASCSSPVWTWQNLLWNWMWNSGSREEMGK